MGLVALIAASSCGTGGTETAAQLVGTEWEVVEMQGFPDDNVVGGEFDFTVDRFRYFDGSNTSSATIEWTEEGFNVEQRGDSTDVAPPEGGQGRLSLVAQPGTQVSVQLMGDTLTLVNGELVVIAKEN